MRETAEAPRPANRPAWLTQLLGAYHALAHAEQRIAREEARWLAGAADANLHHEHGFSTFGDWARERLEMEPRTARRRVTLHRALSASPLLEHAFGEGRVSICQAVLLRDPPPAPHGGGMAEWIDLAGQVSVRELREHLLAARGADDDPAEEPMVPLRFRLPVAAAAVIDEALELARRRLGWDAPRHVALAAILDEVEANLDEDDAAHGSTTAGAMAFGRIRTAALVAGQPEPPPDDPAPGGLASGHPASDPAAPTAPGTPGRPQRAAPRPLAFPSLRAPDDVDRVLRTVRTELARLERLVDVRPSPTGSLAARADATVRHLRELSAQRRPLRVLLAGVVETLREGDSAAFCGHRSFAGFADHELGLSERAARDLVDESRTFADDPHLAFAYEEGRLDLGQLRNVRRFVFDHNREAWIRRAEAVTHRQLAEEVRFLHRLDQSCPRLGLYDPFPGDENAATGNLAHAAGAGGVDSTAPWRPPARPVTLDLAALDATLCAETRSLGWTLETLDAALPHPTHADPALDPRVLERLHTLLDILDLEIRPHDPENDRSETDRQTLSTRLCNRTLAFRVPRSLFDRWQGILRALHARNGPFPGWLSLLSLAHAARAEWLRLDPSARPREHRILERDHWRCQAPGCSRRAQLEVHHITFRSQGGSDDPTNKITLCHAHHRRGIHDNRLALEGEAPAHLTWRLGPLDSPHTETYHGHRRTRPAPDLRDE